MPKMRTAGLTWLDVEEALLSLQEETQGTWSIEVITAGQGLYRKPGLAVILQGQWVRLSGKEGCIRRYRQPWPQYSVRTMPGLVLRSIHEAREDFLARPLIYQKQSKIGSYLPG